MTPWLTRLHERRVKVLSDYHITKQSMDRIWGNLDEITILWMKYCDEFS